MSYAGYITKLKNVRKHPNADRLQLGECFGNTVVVGLDYEEGQLGIYFPTDGKLGLEFAEKNNLLRKKDDAGNSIGGYMDPDKRNVCAVRLRGEKSDGLFMDLSCLKDFCDITTFKTGDLITVLDGIVICEKYIPKTNPSKSPAGGSQGQKKKKDPIAPLFKEHADTEQLAYNLEAFKEGDTIEITLKVHGTSQRTGYLPTLSGYKRTLLDKILRKPGCPIYSWGYVSGTRRVVLDNYDGGFYGSNEFREEHSKLFEGKLRKGETVYYEVVGYTTDGDTIMGTCDNSKLGKDFVKEYGKTTVFNYGCTVGSSDIYVYRMNMTNEDGDIVEYAPDFMRYRCEQMGVKTVPVYCTTTIPNNVSGQTPGDWALNLSEVYYDGADPIGKTHIKEGVVVRILNRPTFKAYKFKNFSFKVLEGIIKDIAETPDMEEAQEVVE